MRNKKTLIQLVNCLRSKLKAPEQTDALKANLINRLKDFKGTRASSLEEKIQSLELLKIIDPDGKPLYDKEKQEIQQELRRRKNAQRGKPVIQIFSASHDKIVLGTEITLNWEVQNAVKISLLDNMGNTIDHYGDHAFVKPVLTANPIGAVIYRLIAENGYGTDERTAGIIVFPVPIFEFITTPVPAIFNDIDITVRLPTLPIHLPDISASFIDKVVFNTDIMNTPHQYDGMVSGRKSTLNLYYLYEQFQKFLRTKRFPGI